MVRRSQGVDRNIDPIEIKPKNTEDTPKVVYPAGQLPESLTQYEIDMNNVNTKVQDLEDTKAPWVDLVDLQVDKIAKDNVINQLQTQVADVNTEKAAATSTQDLSVADVPAPSGVYDQVQLRELTDTVNKLKDKIHSMNNF